jgi:hypothetical protein
VSSVDDAGAMGRFDLRQLPHDSACQNCGAPLAGADARLVTQTIAGSPTAHATYCGQCWAAIGSSSPQGVVGLGDFPSRRSASRPPREFRYMQFAGLCVAVVGASFGEAHVGHARSNAWSLSALIAVLLIAAGQWELHEWKSNPPTEARPDLVDKTQGAFTVYRLPMLVAVAACTMPLTMLTHHPPRRIALAGLMMLGFAAVYGFWGSERLRPMTGPRWAGARGHWKAARHIRWVALAVGLGMLAAAGITAI